MTILKKITNSLIFLLIFLIQNTLFSQNNVNPLIYVHEYKMILTDQLLRDTLVLNKDSTFKYYGYKYGLGIYKIKTEGIFTIKDSALILNSLIQYKRKIKVIEKRSFKKGIRYKHNFKNPFITGGSPFLIELDENFNQYNDTIFFPLGIFENISTNKNVKGFILYDGNEYIEKYIFRNSKSNYIKIGLYPFDYSQIYFRDEKLLIKGKDLIRKYLNKEMIYKSVL